MREPSLTIEAAEQARIDADVDGDLAADGVVRSCSLKRLALRGRQLLRRRSPRP